MKTIKFLPALLLAIGLGIQVFAQTGKEQLVVPLSDPAKPCKLDVRLVMGSIKVTGYDGKDVIIDVESDSPRKEEKTTNGMRRINGGPSLSITAQEEKNTVTVYSGAPANKITLNIKVPMSASSIKLKTVNNGIIMVSNIGSELELNNTNGSIRAENITGSVMANSVNGNVNVVFKSVDATAAMAFTTLNGTVDVTFPVKFKANLKLKTDHGDIFSDFDIAADDTPRKALRTTEKGTYRITADDWVYGKVGGGGAEMLMKTMNGSIYVRKGK